MSKLFMVYLYTYIYGISGTPVCDKKFGSGMYKLFFSVFKYLIVALRRGLESFNRKNSYILASGSGS